jgi:hypothetical protein
LFIKTSSYPFFASDSIVASPQRRVTGAAAASAGCPLPLAACNNGNTDLLRTSFKKFLVFFKLYRMEHSLSSAIRTVGAQICRRLDVLIKAAGMPPVEDIEGTPAPRKPLAGGAFKKNLETPVASAPPKKRGRPPKQRQQQQAASPTAATNDNMSSSEDSEAPQNTAEVKIIFFLCVVFIDTCQVFYCPEHDLYSLVHGDKDFMKEIYTRSEMLECDVTEEELAAAKTGVPKCICFPWVRFLFCFLWKYILLFFCCRLIIAAITNSFGTAKAGDILPQKAKHQVTKMSQIFGRLPQGVDAVASLTPKRLWTTISCVCQMLEPHFKDSSANAGRGKIGLIFFNSFPTNMSF